MSHRTLISFIIPAYNEEALLGRTLEQVKVAAEASKREYEVIVVDDASTDRTVAIAQSFGARVVNVSYRQIAAVRNAGAREAGGEILIFVDADTILPERTLLAALDELDRGAVGGGSLVQLDEKPPFLPNLYFKVFNFLWKPLKYAAGCFVFATRTAFDAAGGFDERYYASEEIWLSRALKAQGRFVILKEPIITSGRKAKLYTPNQLFILAMRLLFKGPKGWQNREGLELWYDGRREPEKK
jgi:glycosyltransferase involved in cell wall biosynthesis